MKKFIYILAISLFSTLQLVTAQNIGNLDGIYYQAVALDDSPQQLVGVDVEAKPLFNREIGVRFTISKGLDGEIQWEETNTTTTDKYGLFTLTIGQGNVASSSYTTLLDIPWIDADQFLKVEISTKNDGDFKLVSNQKFMSVPYAFYADDIADNAITTAKILNEEILSEDIKNETILSDDIATGAVATDEILDETIIADDIASNAVTSEKILDATILNSDIANGTINLKTKVSDTLQVTNGGTGVDASVVNDGQLLIGDGTAGNFQLANITAGEGIEISNTPGGITITSPPISAQTSSDGTFTVNPGSAGVINGNTAWTTPNSLKVTPPEGKAFEMGDIFLVSADSDLKGCILSAYLESIGGDGRANVQVVIFNPSSSAVTLASTLTLKFLLVK